MLLHLYDLVMLLYPESRFSCQSADTDHSPSFALTALESLYMIMDIRLGWDQNQGVIYIYFLEFR